MAKNLFPTRNVITVIETSAKTGHNVKKVFHCAISEVLDTTFVEYKEDTTFEYKEDTPNCLLL